MRRIVSFGPAFVVLLTAGAVLVAAPAAMRRIGEVRTRQRVDVALRELAADDILEQMDRAVRSIGDAVTPSVVHIDAARSWRGYSSTGSGWVYDESGHIITNAHVVGGEERVYVQFHDGRVVQGRVLGADPLTDIAVVGVDAGEHLVPARRATGTRLHPGERVFAFGSPFGFKFSMSQGIISGLGRSARAAAGRAGISNFIQTDAAVNPGNSGGPLVNVNGEVIGMNVAIATAEETGGGVTGQSSGISFAIPLATIESRADQIIAGQPIRTGYIGVQFSLEGAAYGVDGYEGRGVRIGAVVEDSPGDKAGLKAADIITSIGGERVHDGDVLRAMISSHRPGRRVLLGVYRDGREIEVEVTLGEMPADARSLATYGPMLAERFGVALETDDEGVLIGEVVDGADAATAGLERDQRVVSIDGKPVKTEAQALAALADAGLFLGKSVRIVVRAGTDGAAETPVDLRAGAASRRRGR
ncbi:MAG TPA: trypsin-like peptidase domain-containing protein [Phycisphaerales bacterium]|nr:trypsin-like peptidase domain-containing protein [Phycisphaerales bacterium]